MDPEHPSLIRIIEEEIIDYLIRSHFFHPKYVSTLGLKGNERILEFGCGGGVMSRAIAHSIQLGGHLTVYRHLRILDKKSTTTVEKLWYN